MNPDAVAQLEQATIAAALHCSTAEVRATGLEPTDFLLAGAGQIWHLIQRMDPPSSVQLALQAPRLNVDVQRWVAEWMDYTHPACFRAHAALVKAESGKRQAVQGHVDEINEIRQSGHEWWGSKYQENA